MIDAHPTRDRGLNSGDTYGNSQSTPYKESRSIRQSTLDQLECEIEKLLDRVAKEDFHLFRVRLKGHGPQEQNWEPEGILPQEMVRAAKLRANLA